MSKDRVSQLKHEFFQLENLQVMDVNQTIALEAARIRREYHFRISDSIQLATAKNAKVDLFITNDLRLKMFKEIDFEFLSENSF